MSVNHLISAENKHVIISIDNKFYFTLHQYFRDSYSSCNQLNTTFFLDLSKTEYMDSSALGMILLLKEHAESLDGDVIIQNSNKSILKILEIAQFHHLVTIEL